MTNVWEPKPSATPMMPALATTGPMSSPRALSIMVAITATTTPELMLFRRLPMVRARCTRRVEPDVGGEELRPSVAWVIRSGSAPSSALRTSRSIRRWSTN